MRVWHVCMQMREESKQAIEAVQDTIIKGWTRDANMVPAYALPFLEKMKGPKKGQTGLLK